MPSTDFSIQFGTSGLRGLADAFTDEVVGAYVIAFLEFCGPGDGPVLVGMDLRSSSPRIAAAVCSAATAAGYQPVFCGVLPTPALALHGMASSVPGIMVTGSHIPETHNGIKFYRPKSELLKADEQPVGERAIELYQAGTDRGAPERLPQPDHAAARRYQSRIVDAFAGEALSGLKIGVDQHSAAGRDMLADVLRALGAQVFGYRRLDQFLAVDTEALPAEDLALAQEQIHTHGLDAVVSTDGDGDRPLMIDAAGRQINGDVLGALTARALGIRQVVTPLTSTTGIELSGWFDKVRRTRIGSPYVVEAMAMEEGPVAGFEANGGFLLGTDLHIASGHLPALPTRDAILPLVAVLAAANAQGRTVAQLASDLPPRFMKADRIKNIANEVSQRFLQQLADSRDARTALHPGLADPVLIEIEDGVRMHLADRSIVHFRASGNAPELRCYVETSHQAETDEWLGKYLAALRTHLGSTWQGQR